MPRQDFILDKDGDFPLEDTIDNSGKYLPTPYGNSDTQHKIDILMNNFGALKRFPLLGFGIFKYENSEFNLDEVNKNLTLQMKNDGYTVVHGCVSINPDGGFLIDTDYIKNSYEN